MYANATRLDYIRRTTMLGVFCAIAYVVMVIGRIPTGFLFLKYDPKDVIIAFSGLIYGPMSAFLVSLVVSLVEMITVSDTGPWGLLMNVLGTCSFACTAAFIYKRWQTLRGAVAGMIAGVMLMVPVMLLWNYLVTPIYMGWPREEIAAILVPAFLPFNLIKGGLNACLTLLLYKPLVRALRAANLLPPREVQLESAADGQAVAAKKTSRKETVGVMICVSVVLVSCILLLLVKQGIL